MKVLAISQSFAPGFRGGSIQALNYMVERLGHQCEFWVVARDRDPGLTDRLPGVEVDRWTTRGHARVFYASHPHHPRLLAALVAQVQPDVVFVNSLFARGSIAFMTLRRASRLSVPVVVAPEGELAAGALMQKPRRKRAFLSVARALRLLAGVTWLARDAGEQSDIARAFPGAEPASVVPCLGPATPRPIAPAVPKAPGTLSLLYLSRITPKKNLAFLLELLCSDAGGGTSLDIVGPIDDQRYWARCRELMARLPASVHARYHGESMPDEVPGWLARAHALVLPTLGENYGYVVAEALEAGRPVLVSDRTPWDDLQATCAGFTLPLSPGPWTSAIAHLRGLSQAEHRAWCDAARARGLTSRATEWADRATLDVLRRAAALTAAVNHDDSASTHVAAQSGRWWRR